MLVSYLINWCYNTYLEQLLWFIKKSKQFNHSNITSNISALILTLSVNGSLQFFIWFNFISHGILKTSRTDFFGIEDISYTFLLSFLHLPLIINIFINLQHKELWHHCPQNINTPCVTYLAGSSHATARFALVTVHNLNNEWNRWSWRMKIKIVVKSTRWSTSIFSRAVLLFDWKYFGVEISRRTTCRRHADDTRVRLHWRFQLADDICHPHIVRTSSAGMYVIRTSSAALLMVSVDLNYLSTVTGTGYWMEFVTRILSCFISGSYKWFAI